MSQRPITPPTSLAAAIIRFAHNAWNLHRAISILGAIALLIRAICLTATYRPGNWPAAFGIALLAYPALRLDLTDPDNKAEIQP